MRDEYFEWIFSLVSDTRHPAVMSFRKLLTHLFNIEYYVHPSAPLDKNRASDGRDLRYRFGRQAGYDDRFIEAHLDIYDCTVLEMILALAIRCEEDVMDNAEIGDRTSQWFWIMIVNLGLGGMTDVRYDPDIVDEVIRKFLEREYEPNGKGNIFYVRNAEEDLRTLEIWNQMFLYLNNIT